VKTSRRYLVAQVKKDILSWMVLLAGPREVGKTTLARSLPGAETGYLNWDAEGDRHRLLTRDMPRTRLWVLDEIHKYRGWRNFLKGLWDGRRCGQRILVTGSGRLEYYSFGGDSLQGRYRLLHLHPFSVAELGIGNASGLRDLLVLGGFPVPFLHGSREEARRWSIHHRAQIIREEVVSLEQVIDLGRLELLMLSLPERVGSPLSINALSEDLRVKHATVERWVQVFERLYVVFRLPPFGAPRLRAVKKERKHYHFDWSLVPGEGPRFENLVACHLLKWVDFERDTKGRDLELRYFRDVDGREVDFVVLEDRKAILLVEAKAGDAEPDRGLRYLYERFRDAEAWQISARGRRDYQTPTGIRVAPALEFLKTLV